jgi:hypothetical protein
MATSSANPDKLQRYADDGVTLDATLKAKADALSGALASLRPSVSGGDNWFVPHLGDIDASLEDLAGDWYHLDEFVGDVAKGFRLAGADTDGDGVYDAPDVLIAQRGQVGFADRDVAVRTAQEMARELERLRGLDRDPTPEEIRALGAMAGRGQYDPAFAVTFSEAVGAEGYVKAMTLIRKAYGNDPVGPEGMAVAQILGTTLTTALDTLPGVPPGDRHDLSNQSLPDDQRLGAEFVRDLTGGYQLAGDETGVYHHGETSDLSVLLRFTEPPTAVAIDIANSRLTPLLGKSFFDQPYEISDPTSDPWGEYDDPVVNYATMLGRDEDAAALYLDGTTEGGEDVVGLVLQRNSGADLDGGRAIADLVRAGVTHDVLGASILDSSIDAVGDDEHGTQELRNPHLADALAAGVAENMDVIERRATLDRDGNQFDARSPETLEAHDFLREVMRDETAAQTVRAAAAGYVQDRYAELPPGFTTQNEGDPRYDGLVDIGRVLGMTETAHENAVVGAAEDKYAAQQDVAGRINTSLGLLGAPGVVYSGYTLTVPLDYTLGAVLVQADSGPVDAATQQAIDNAIRHNANPAGLAVFGSDVDVRIIQAGGDDIEDAAKDRD